MDSNADGSSDTGMPIPIANRHPVAAVATEAVSAIEILQLHSTPSQLEEAAVLIQQLPYRRHIPSSRLTNQPNWMALPLSNTVRSLTLKLKILR